MGTLISNFMASAFLLIMAYLIFVNYKGFTAAMKESGSTTVNIVKALQGR